MNAEQAAALRAPFPKESIGQIPKGGAQLDYVGHAAVTDRLLQVDPEWTWEPVAWAANGTPLWAVDGNDAVMWIKLTVAGVTRFGVGICKDNAFELEKQLISDALRNAAMRFGVALDLWSKEDLQASVTSAGAGAGETAASPTSRSAASGQPPAPAPTSAGASASSPARQVEAPAEPSDEWHPPAIELHDAKALVRSLIARGVSVYDARKRDNLPKLDENCDAASFRLWQRLIADLDTANPVEINA